MSLTVPEVLGICEGDTIELWRGADVRRGVYRRWEFFGRTYGPDLITEWLISPHPDVPPQPTAYDVEKCIAIGWNIRKVEVSA